ncbi:MAG: SpvB/TcaC N-terminal domain-containing protein [Mariprofundaceae bacterium]|nr:SpvB/TcaC N-terminal domain-containing protein [Mariprofundaceae bacterium]
MSLSQRSNAVGGVCRSVRRIMKDSMVMMCRVFLLALWILPCAAHAAVDMSAGRSDVAAYTGSFRTGIPIAVAPGRAGLQPSLSLQYTSGMGNGLYGMGWSLDIARIERQTKNGSPGYTDNDIFVLVMKGARQTLVRQAGGEFRVRNEGAFLRIRKQGDGWLVQDKSGTKYFFGLDDARQQSLWPVGVAQAFSWQLSKVVDMSGNVMRFFYANDADGQRISHIDYAPGNQVVFSYEARSDIIQNYRSGFLQRIGVRLKSVKSYAGNALAHHLELVYGALPNDPRSLLTQAIVHDPDGKLADRVTQFGYAAQQINAFTGRWEKTPEYVQPVTYFTYPVYGRPKAQLRRISYPYADMNGDGKAEMLSVPSGASSLMVGYGTMPNTPWAVPEGGLKQSTTFYCGRIHHSHGIRWRNGCIAPGQGIPPGSRLHAVTSSTYYPRALVDINGDGLPDWAVKTASGTWHVYLNNGRVFNSTPQTWADPSGGGGDYLLDVNGDGLPDLLDGAWMAYINLGDHFSPAPVLSAVTAVPYALGLDTASLPANQTGALVPVLTPSLWRKSPLMTLKTNMRTGLKQVISYQVQSGIANASKLKLWTAARIASSGSGVEARSVTYAYTGGLYAKSVKEFRGFATVTATDEQSGHVTTTAYNQDVVFQGRPKSVETRLTDGTLISRVTNTWSAKQFDGGKRHFAYVSNSISESYELDGSLIEQTVTDNAYDDYGNLTDSTIRSGGFAGTVANLYRNNAVCGMVSQARTRMVSVTKTHMVAVTKYRWVSRFQRYVGSARYRRNAGYRSRVNRLIRRYPYGSRQRYTVQAPQKYTVQIPEIYYVQVPDPNCWQIGQLAQSTVTKSTPSGDTATRTSAFAYDAKGRLVEETIEPGGSAWQKTSYAYDTLGNSTTTTVTGAGISAHTTTVAYDASGLFPVSTTNALGHKESYTWDTRFGVKAGLTGPNGLTTIWQHDGFGRKTAEIRADGTRTDITRHMDTAPLYVTTQSTGSPAKTAYYDARGRAMRTETVGFAGNPVYVDTEYDALGRVARKSLPYTAAPGGWTAYAYDVLNRAVNVTTPDGSVTSTAYNGLTTTVTNALRQTKITVTNAIGKVVSVTDTANGIMQYAYDAFGNLTQTTDAAGNVTTMAYDIRGRKISMADPDMGYWTYAYDALSNLVSQTDAKAQVTTMAYDKLGRMVSRTEAEGASSWTYDTLWVGALSSETGGIASKAYIYDTYGRVKSASTTINGQTYNVSTGYDNIGRVGTITYPTGITIKRNYSAAGFLQSVSNAASGAIIWQANSMDAFGHVTSESFGNGVTTTRSYDPKRGVLTGLQSTSGSATIQNWAYDYDAVGNMQFRTDSVVGYTERFQYDPYHPHAVSAAGGNTYAYDANGNQISGAGRSFTWTSFNKPSGISTANGYTGFQYDASHNRILKTTPTTTTAYIGKIYQQTTMNGVIKDVSNIYAGRKLVASIEEVAGLSTIKYMHGDHLGSISVITDAGGAVIERLRFDVFGAPVDPNTGAAMTSFGASNTERGYTGHEMDASTGLINMNARLYDPVLGRFLSADTIVPSPGNMQGFNRYSYVLNNPLLYIDPTGHSWWTNFRDSVLKPVAIIAASVAIAWLTYGLVQPYVTGSLLYGGIGYGAGQAAVIAGAAAGGAAAGFAAGATAASLYGGNTSDIWRAARRGAIGGGVAGGVAAGLIGFGAPTELARPFGAVSSNLAQGGNSESAVLSFGLSVGGMVASRIYKAYTTYAASFKPGNGLASSDGTYNERNGVPGAPNVFGINSRLTHVAGVPDWLVPSNFFKQGGPVSLIGNYLLPAGHAISIFHDTEQIALGSPDSWSRIIGNVPAMVPAAAISYTALIYGGSIPGTVVIDAVRQ